MTDSKLRPSLLLTGLALLAAATAPTSASAGGPFFEEAPGAFSAACGGNDGCWTNYLRLADLDGDDDLDVVFVNYAGFFSNGTPEPLAFYENDGGAFTDISASAVNGHTERIRQVAIGDVDGDGDLDVFAPGARGAGSAFFINQGGLVFVDEFEIRMPAAQPNVGATRFGDFDNDGDLDLFSADGYTSSPDVYGHVYLNDGMGVFTEVDGAAPAAVAGDDIDDIDLLDANGDFIVDVLLNPHQGDNSLWLGVGDGTFTDATDGFPGQPHVFHYNPGVCDVDGDGDLDVWVDNQGPDIGPSVPTEQLLINDGSGVFTDETEARVMGNPSADDNGIICADVDNDGDFDAIVVALSTRERYLQNDGSGNFTMVNGTFGGSIDSSLWGEFGDVNGDGRIDLVTGQGEGATIDQLYLASRGVPVDDSAPTFRAIESVEAEVGPVVLRVAIADRDVSDMGPRLSSVSASLTGDGTDEMVAATFMGGDLFRVEFPEVAQGSYTIDVCATDVAGNEGCEQVMVEVTDDGGTDTDGPDTDGGSETSDGNLGSTSGETPGASDSNDPTVPGSSSSSSSTATAGDTDGDTDGDSAGSNGGGGCRVGGDVPFGALGILALFGLVARCRTESVVE